MHGELLLTNVTHQIVRVIITTVIEVVVENHSTKLMEILMVQEANIESIQITGIMLKFTSKKEVIDLLQLLSLLVKVQTLSLDKLLSTNSVREVEFCA